jgi:PAS domain S-box-containing protein
MKTESLLNRKVQLAFGSAILALLVVGAMSFRGMAVSSESERWVRHTHEVLEKLQDLLSAMRIIEDDYRGFVITGDESNLKSYRAATVSVEQDEAAVRALTVDNPIQQSQISNLEDLVGQEIQFGEMVISLRRNRGTDAATDAIRTGQDRRIMDGFQGVVREVQNEELRLLSLRDADAKRGIGQTKTVLILGTVLGVMIAAAAGWSAQRDGSRGALAAETLRDHEERYRLLLGEIRDYAIFMLNPQGMVVSWNAGAERIKGYTAEQIIGHNFSCFFPLEDIERGRPEEILRMTIKNGRHEEKGIRVRKGGSRFLASITFTALRDRTGKLRGFSEFSHDLSESKESGARYRGLLEAAPDAIVIADAQGRIVLINASTERLFGYRRDELVGQLVEILVPERFRAAHPQHRQGYTAHPHMRPMDEGLELCGLRKDNTEFPAEIMLSPLESAEGTLVTAAIRNISVRKAAEKHLAQMEGRYRGLLEAAPDAMVVVNQAGEIVLLNVQAEKQFGYHRDELVGQEVKNIIPEGFAERLIADGLRSVEDALAQQIGAGIELTGRRKDGSDFPIEIMLSPLTSAEGILVTAAIRDISVRKDAEKHLVKTMRELARANRKLVTEIAERRQVEAELSSSHAEAERLLSSISSILIGVDDHGRVTRWNAAAASTFAIPSEAALDRPFDDLGIHWHALGVGESMASMASIAALGKSPRLDDLEFRDAAGKVRSLGATIHPIHGEQGQHRGFVFLGVEISQRKQLQEQLRQAQKLEAIGQLAAGVAHEINTPTQYVGDNIRFLEESWNKLNPLLRLIGRLSQPAEGSALSRELAAELHAAVDEADINYLIIEVPKALAQSLDGVEQVSQIVKAMREFSHRGSLEKESADLNRAIEAAITVSRNEWKYVADVKTDLDPALPLVQCVIGQLQQVILNLLINAAHAIGEKIGPDSQQKGVIHVTTRLVPDAVEIRVEDTGTGIPEELRSRVFEPFFTTKLVGKGTGQGLALVHSAIVEGHSGKVWIESPPGKGAAFVIQLPLETLVGTEKTAPEREPTSVPE